MRIGIDARMWKETGVGRYIRSILNELQNLDSKNEYVLFVLPEDLEKINLPPNFKLVPADIRWHSVAEQIKLPWLFWKSSLDLLWVPHFNVPLLYFRPFFTTIHDLTPLKVKTGRVTTLPYPVFMIKYLAAALTFFNSAKRSKKIFCVSEYVKKDIVKRLHVPANKIEVTYNAVGSNFYRRGQSEIEEVCKKYQLRRPFLLYLGNAQPHKNLEGMFEAFFELSKIRQDINLVIGGRKTFFHTRLEQELPIEMRRKINFTGFIEEEDLPALYSASELFVNPSFSEGFGIQVLEALACETKVACSNTTSLPEVAGNCAYYFNPADSADMTRVIAESLESTSTEKNREGLERVKLFSWQKSATTVLKEANSYAHSHNL